MFSHVDVKCKEEILTVVILFIEVDDNSYFFPLYLRSSSIKITNEIFDPTAQVKSVGRDTLEKAMKTK